ncbi:transketolase [Heliobacillus mobilis]|uniref:Transketolase n=1 Tax=Heliobacterium mobile TaxID=28064 RepID=A0A6I3SMY1_HELMO|nr:transketolase [Heliobacterium mobile]MTV49687.1 transketolase [Heliobacterium mobile]
MIHLEKKANWVRNQVLEMTASAKKGHIGGAFSAIDVLVALYYGGFLRFNPSEPAWEDRDRFILSKGHSTLALYVILADLGFTSWDAFKTYGQNGSFLGAHPDHAIPGIEVDSGSLGNGLGMGAGMALAAKMDQKPVRTVVLLGDGECYEGAIWEAVMFAGHHGLNNLIAIVDRNGQCVTDYTEDCNRLEPFTAKWEACGWEVLSIDGHSFAEIGQALDHGRNRSTQRPLLINAKTIKGKGVSFMEGALEWHHSVPNGEKLVRARRELTWTE